MSEQHPEALRLERISRRFGELKANDEISITIRKGEVHALLGENGAGKSTLMRIVAGVISPDSGTIHVDGRQADIRSPHDAGRLGIQMVHQHFALIGSLTVAENLHLARATSMRGRVVLDDIRAELAHLRSEYGIQLDPDALVDDLTVGSQQRLEIARALILNARVLVLDEPTAVLTPTEVEDLFRLLRNLRRDGVAIIFISHKLAEVLAISDRVTVLRQGRVVDSLETRTATIERLSLAVVGRPVSLGRRERVSAACSTDVAVLELDGVSTAAAPDRVQLRDVSLAVRSGEIVGIAGVDGNGQSELIDVVVGIVAPTAGTVRTVEPGPVAHADAALMLAHIPDDRGRKGLVLSMTCLDNILLRHRHDPRLFRFGMVRAGSARQHVAGLLRRFMVRDSAIDEPAGRLSGGNQQRVLLARELDGAPQIIVAGQPTRGVDVAGAAFVHDTLRAYRDRGAGILMVSTELEELLALSDRILVMFRGQVMGEVRGECADPLELGAMMMGNHKHVEARL
jgi:simple sugar transport system ATP-binding protein